MFRLLMLLAVIGLAAWLFKKLFLDGQIKAENTDDDKALGLMQKCIHCDLHLPSEQGIIDGKNFFCCEQHRDEYLSK